MIQQLLKTRDRSRNLEANQREVIELLRAMVLAPPVEAERLHAMFLDQRGSFLGDAPIGNSYSSSLSLRMRELFEMAFEMGASGIILAHNHPSGNCRPSQYDVDSTRRLKQVAQALDIELLDHLIFTRDAVYSMRAGGNL